MPRERGLRQAPATLCVAMILLAATGSAQVRMSASTQGGETQRVRKGLGELGLGAKPHDRFKGPAPTMRARAVCVVQVRAWGASGACRATRARPGTSRGRCPRPTRRGPARKLPPRLAVQRGREGGRAKGGEKKSAQTCMYEASCRRTRTRIEASGCQALPDAQSLNIQGDIRAPRAAIADVTPLTCAHAL